MVKRYASDLTDEQWPLLEPLPCDKDPTKGGRPRTWPVREIVNAIFYLKKTGCQWRMIPEGFPPKETVWGHFRIWRDCGKWEEICLALNKKVGKEETPSVLIVDSQSVKTALKRVHRLRWRQACQGEKETYPGRYARSCLESVGK